MLWEKKGKVMNPKLYLRQAPERRLVITLAMSQAQQILQMPQLELGQWLQEEIEKNPLLELDSYNASYPEKELRFPLTLRAHLSQQIWESFTTDPEKQIASLLLDHLDERGFLTAIPENIPEELFSSVLLTVQTFTPFGIFARNLQESLLIQLKMTHKEEQVSYHLVRDYFQDLLHGRFEIIKKELGITDLRSAIHDLTRLSLRPAHGFEAQPVTPIIADLELFQVEGEWKITLNDETLPKFHIRTEYLSLESASREERETLKGFKTQAKWLLRALHRRQKLLEELANELISKQIPFLNQESPLFYVSAKELSEKLSIHESTLSRLLASKYISTPTGHFPLRALLTNHPHQQTAQQILQELIEREDKQNPLTDEELAKELSQKGARIARRTIAKYRRALKIGTATQRKHLWGRPTITFRAV